MKFSCNHSPPCYRYVVVNLINNPMSMQWLVGMYKRKSISCGLVISVQLSAHNIIVTIQLDDISTRCSPNACLIALTLCVMCSIWLMAELT